MGGCQVYLASLQRWVHVDVGELAFDNPFLYELGWGKQLTFIIAVSTHSVVDVTFRYSIHHAPLRARRAAEGVREEALVRGLQTLQAEQWANVSAEMRAEGMDRLRVEQEEFKRNDNPHLIAERQVRRGGVDVGRRMFHGDDCRRMMVICGGMRMRMRMRKMIVIMIHDR